MHFVAMPQRWRERFAGLDVPNACRHIHAAGYQPLSVAAECQAVHPIVVPQWWRNRGAGRCIPKTHFTLPSLITDSSTHRNNQSIVWAELDIGQVKAMVHWFTNLKTRLAVPKSSNLVLPRD